MAVNYMGLAARASVPDNIPERAGLTIDRRRERLGITMLRRIMMRPYLALTVVGAFALSGCSETDWNWGRSSSASARRDKPVTRSEPAPAETRTAAARPKEPTASSTEDSRAREVDEQVARYVESMNTQSDSGYVRSDLNSKIQRQSDPERANRIRQTAARARGDRPPLEPDSSLETPAERGSEASSSAASPGALEEYAGARPVSRSTEEPTVSGHANESPVAARDHEKPVEAHSSRAGGGTQSEVTELPTRSEPEPTAESSSTVSANASTESTPPAKPPALSEISIEPVSPKQESAANPQPKSTDNAAPQSSERALVNAIPTTPISTADAIKARIAEQEKLVAREPDNLEEQFRLRLMYLIDGQDDRATDPIPGLNSQMQEIVRGQIAALLTARGTSERDPTLWANRQLDAIENLRALVRAQADLRVPRVELCSAIDGFGRYEPIVPPQFTVGGRNQVIVYMEVDNFQTEKTSTGLYRALMSVRASLLNKSGEEIWSMRDENIEDLSRQRRSDFFLTIGPLAIPKTLGPGEYVMKVEVEDVVGGKIGSNFAKFKMLP